MQPFFILPMPSFLYILHFICFVKLYYFDNAGRLGSNPPLPDARCQEDSLVITVDRAGLRRLMGRDCYLGFVIMEKLAEIISMRLRETRLQLTIMIHG